MKAFKTLKELKPITPASQSKDVPCKVSLTMKAGRPCVNVYTDVPMTGAVIARAQLEGGKWQVVLINSVDAHSGTYRWYPWNTNVKNGSRLQAHLKRPEHLDFFPSIPAVMVCKQDLSVIDLPAERPPYTFRKRRKKSSGKSGDVQILLQALNAINEVKKRKPDLVDIRMNEDGDLVIQHSEILTASNDETDNLL